jgi:transcriptional regulator with XRE-family HTH domain
LDQKKIGALLKKLRTERGLTQEQFAELVMVSNRTVSRWENGNNMPDLDILIQISDYYEIDLRELLDGERKSENMNRELEENVLKAVEYTNCETERYTKKVHRLLFVVAIFWFVSQFIGHTGLAGNNILNAICDFAEGAVCGMTICGLVVTGRYGQRIRAFKQRLLKRQGGQQV